MENLQTTENGYSLLTEGEIVLIRLTTFAMRMNTRN